jgi:hypothetical protein
MARWRLFARSVLEEGARRHFQSLGEPLQGRDGGVADSALDTADIGPVQATVEGELFLGHLAVLAKSPDVEPDPAPDIHGRRGAERCLSIYRL